MYRFSVLSSGTASQPPELDVLNEHTTLHVGCVHCPVAVEPSLLLASLVGITYRPTGCEDLMQLQRMSCCAGTNPPKQYLIQWRFGVRQIHHLSMLLMKVVGL